MSPQQHRRELSLSKNPLTQPLPLEPGSRVGFTAEDDQAPHLGFELTDWMSAEMSWKAATMARAVITLLRLATSMRLVPVVGSVPTPGRLSVQNA